MECLGGCVIFIAIFVGHQSLLQQHILLTIGSFVYGVPIPLAHLLNETRVRNIIIHKGWLEGFKSIFYSPKKIKQLERERIVNYLHDKSDDRVQCERVRMNVNGYQVIYQKGNVDNLQNRIPVGTSHILESNQTRKNESPSKKIFQWGQSVKFKQIPYFSNGDGLVASEHSHAVIETNYSLEETTNGELHHKNVCSKELSERDQIKEDYETSITDTTSKDEFCEINLTKSILPNKLLMCSDISFITSFSEQSDKVINLLVDENFKLFSRRYILRNLVKLLKNHAKESDYKKCFGHLCCLESYPVEQKDTESKLNFIISLINAWYLNQKRPNGLIPNDLSTFQAIRNEDKLVNIDQPQNQIKIYREKYIHQMLESVLIDHQYYKYLEALYDLEDEQEEEELVYGW